MCHLFYLSNKMSYGVVRDALYLLLIVVDFLLNIVQSCGLLAFCALKLLIQLFAANMTESSKKRRKNSSGQTNQTVALRGLISANWQNFLSSNLIMDKKTQKLVEANKKDHFTGTFRRARKKKSQISDFVENNLKTLNLNNKDNNNIENDDLLVSSIALENKNSVILGKKDNSKRNTVTKFLAMDCEMVGIGYDGNDHMLARVSIVNKFGDCIYDKFVKAREEVIDYRTEVSGIRREDMLNGEDFTTVQKEVSELIKGRILVGHSLKNDLSVLFLSHPKKNVRDTSRYKPFRKVTKGSTPSLKRLAKEILGIEIQHGEHSSVEDARAAMQLYCTVAKKWEGEMSQKRGYNKKFVED